MLIVFYDKDNQEHILKGEEVREENSNIKDYIRQHDYQEDYNLKLEG